MEKKNSKRGFTLVELIVVLVILAILAALRQGAEVARIVVPCDYQIIRIQ